jgi:hypothetical protein
MDRDAEACLEPSITCTETDVGGGEQVDPAAHTGGVHGADNGLGTGHQAGEQALQRRSSDFTIIGKAQRGSEKLAINPDRIWIKP